MIDDERPDAPDEQPAEPETPGGEEEAPEPSSSADPSESPAAGEEGAPAEEPAGDSEPAAEEPAGEEPASEEPVAAEQPAEEPAPDPAADAPEAPAPEPAADEPAPEAVAAPDASSQPADDAAADAPAADAPPAEERPKRDKRKKEEGAKEADVVPGAHLEPDLVLEAARPAGEEDELARYGTPEDGEPAAEGEADEAGDAPAAAPEPARSVLDLAAGARYRATGKRKTAVARVIISPGDGGYTVNGRSLEDFFPRAALQKAARQPLEVAGFERRMNVVARIHGGGVSAQAGALRHGVARALVEADPALRPELKRRGLLTRDARAKERKKAGLKKARKRPQFSKR